MQVRNSALYIFAPFLLDRGAKMYKAGEKNSVSEKNPENVLYCALKIFPGFKFMIAISPSLYNFFSRPCETLKECVQTRVYSVKKAFSKCWESDCKIYTFLILGRVLQAIGVAASLAAVVGAFILGPVTLLALVPSVGTYVLGHFFVENNRMDTGAVETDFGDEFVQGKPVGLRNTTNNCWINSFLQCVMHIPVLQDAAREVPELAPYVGKYLRQQNKAQRSSEFSWGKLNADLVKVIQRRGKNELSFGGQADVAPLFEWLFNTSGSMYQMEQTVTNPLDEDSSQTQIAVDMLRLGMDADGPNDATELLNAFFDHYTDEGTHCTKEFIAAPDTLVCQLQRYCYKENKRTGALNRVQIKGPVEGIHDVTLDIAGEPVEYTCDAFIVHKGSFGGGHYIAYIKKDGQWWCCDDSRVSAVSNRAARQMMKRCYLFFLNREV